MAFRTETAARGRFTVFILSGRIEKQAIAELRRLLECQTDYRNIVLDLKDVGVIDRDVMRFAGGIPRRTRNTKASFMPKRAVDSIHKDIKPANALIDDAGNVSLTGFGIASQLPHGRL